MALFDEALIQEITALARQRYQELGKALGEVESEQDGKRHLNKQSELYRDLALLIEIANGKHARGSAPGELLEQIELALQRLLDVLLGNPLRAHVTIPDAFWQSSMGILVSRARWWVSAEDLITISNAAALAFGENTQAHRMRIARAIDHGLLAWVPDPSVANPQQNKRVLRSQVERLRAQRSLPE